MRLFKRISLNRKPILQHTMSYLSLISMALGAIFSLPDSVKENYPVRILLVLIVAMFATVIRRIIPPLLEGTLLEHRLERDKEDGHDGKAAQLVSIISPQDLVDMELGKELLNLGRSSFTGVMMTWYNIHGISPLFVLWIFGYFHYTKWR